MRTAFKLVEFLIRSLPFELWITTLTIPPLITTLCQPLTVSKSHIVPKQNEFILMMQLLLGIRKTAFSKAIQLVQSKGEKSYKHHALSCPLKSSKRDKYGDRFSFFGVLSC